MIRHSLTSGKNHILLNEIKVAASACHRRENYFPVSYIKPITGNKNALGFNLASNQKRLAALNLAKETGKLAITASIQLVQDKGVHKSFLAVISIYTKTGQQKRSIEGYITGVFQIGELINNALKKNIRAQYRPNLIRPYRANPKHYTTHS